MSESKVRVNDLMAELKSSLAMCPTACDADCDAGCHEAHQVPLRRTHQPQDCPSAGVEVDDGD